MDFSSWVSKLDLRKLCVPSSKEIFAYEMCECRLNTKVKKLKVTRFCACILHMWRGEVRGREGIELGERDGEGERERLRESVCVERERDGNNGNLGI